MRGYPAFNFPAFAEAAARLRAAGYGVVSPHELHDGRLDLSWGEYMRRDLALLCSGAIGGIALLEDWQKSQGASIEASVGTAIGLRKGSVLWWLAGEKR